MKRLIPWIGCLALAVAGCADASKASTDDEAAKVTEGDETAEKRERSAKTNRTQGDDRERSKPDKPATVSASDAPKCTKIAKALIAKGKACEVDMSNYDARRLCGKYMQGDGLDDNMAAGKLNAILSPPGGRDGCDAIRSAHGGGRL